MALASFESPHSAQNSELVVLHEDETDVIFLQLTALSFTLKSR